MIVKQFFLKATVIGVVLLFTLVLFFECSSIETTPAPSGLMVDLLSKPESAVITSSQPNFSWIVAGEESIQSGYQILLASDENILKQDK